MMQQGMIVSMSQYAGGSGLMTIRYWRTQREMDRDEGKLPLDEEALAEMDNAIALLKRYRATLLWDGREGEAEVLWKKMVSALRAAKP